MSDEKERVAAVADDGGVWAQWDEQYGGRIECDAVGCTDLAEYRFRALWLSDDEVPFYACLVHVPWAIKELNAFRIEGRAPVHIFQTVLQHPNAD